jgi:small-conductance mechanosensitive channel
MNVALLEKPLFYVAGHYVSFLGLLAFAILFAIGLGAAKTLQADVVRRFFARFKLDTNFIAIVTTILSVSALAFSPLQRSTLRAFRFSGPRPCLESR